MKLIAAYLPFVLLLQPDSALAQLVPTPIQINSVSSIERSLECHNDLCEGCVGDAVFRNCSETPAHWTDNLSVFAGLDGSKQPQDVGINAHFGGRIAVNLGIPVVEESGLGIQLGTAITVTDAAVGVLEVIDGTNNRAQSFTTLGVFQRASSGNHWALVWDLLKQDYYDDTTLQQLRGRIGWQTSSTDQFGVWGTWSTGSTQWATVAGTDVRLSPIDQVSVFWNRRWPSQVTTECWLGVADGHGEVIHVFPGNRRVEPAAVFGAMLHVPLNERVSIYGQGNFILPADSGTVDAYLGVAFHLGRLQATRRQRYDAPPLDIAGNTSFAVDLTR